MFNKSRLHKKIIAIQKDLKESVELLNYGGCIHFAYYLSDALKTLDIPHKVYFCDYNVENLGNTFKTFNSCYHVVVYIEGIGFIDGHNTHKKSPYTYNRIFRFDLNRARTEYIWNYTYKKTIYNKIVLRTIKKHLNDY